MEVAAAAGKENFVAGGGVEEGGGYWCGAEVEVCEEGIWIWWVGRYVVEGKGGGGARGEEEGEGGVE